MWSKYSLIKTVFLWTQRAPFNTVTSILSLWFVIFEYCFHVLVIMESFVLWCSLTQPSPPLLPASSTWKQLLSMNVSSWRTNGLAKMLASLDWSKSMPLRSDGPECSTHRVGRLGAFTLSSTSISTSWSWCWCSGQEKNELRRSQSFATYLHVWE
jgi:hypothetical protein